MPIIRFAQLKPQPWRNGGGVTREIASLPAAASDSPAKGRSGDEWDWRVSIAEVTKAGDFSFFPGMERVLTVIEGDHMVLTGDGWDQTLEKYRPFRFSGDTPVHGALPRGGIRDLNVFTRTGSFEASTSITELSPQRPHPILTGQLGILFQGQAAATGHAEEPMALAQYDAVMGADGESAEISGQGLLAVVSITRHGSSVACNGAR